MSEEKSYLWSKIKKNNLGSVKELKDKSLAKEIGQLIAYKGTIIQSKTNDAEFMIQNGTVNERGIELLCLHECDIEDGGPQPRTEINPSDPETQALFELIKTNGQRVPINVYPSPNTPGKYRIAEGHRRRMIIFNMLRLDGIWAVSKQRSELEAYEDAFDLNNARKNISATDQARFFQTLMSKFPTVYPNQQAIADRRKLSKFYVSQILSALKLVDSQKENVTEEVFARANYLTEGQLRPIRTVEDKNLQSVVLEQVVTKDMSMRDVQKLAEAVNANPEPTSEFVAEEAQRIKIQKAEVRVQEYRMEADKITAKTERARDKIVACVEYPEDLMKAAFGVLGLKGKVTPEKAKSLASIAVAVLIQKCVEKQIFAVDTEGKTHLYELADLFREAQTWA